MALTVEDYMEVDGSPNIESVRVKSTSATGDKFVSRKFGNIKAVIAQNHGATFASGVVRDPPKIVITNSTAGTADVEIQHTATDEFFSLFILGEL